MYGEEDDIYYDHDEMSELEDLGFDQKIINYVDPGGWLCYENCIFDFRGQLVKQFDHHIGHHCINTNDPFD